jgi:hypothetical protein
MQRTHPRPVKGAKLWLRALVVIIILAFVGLRRFGGDLIPGKRTSKPASTESAPNQPGLVQAIEQHRSGLVFDGEGQVTRLLADDNDGSRHQRFILRLGSGHTLLVSHNIDLAERLPVEVGDQVRFRGQYEWNDRGGVLHWTHHDPQGRREGGWLELDGQRYR